MSDPSLTGGCLCGGVRFELTEPAREAGYCHCTRCQRRTGAAASAQARIDARTFRLVKGEELVKCWRPGSGGFEKCFCGECGAHLFRAFVAYACAWEPIPEDGLERYEEAKPRPPLD
jgi:hypothetical protein